MTQPRQLLLVALLVSGCATGGGSPSASAGAPSPTGPYGQQAADYVKAFLQAGYLVGDAVNTSVTPISEMTAEPCALNIFRPGAGMRLDFRRLNELNLGTIEVDTPISPRGSWVEVAGGTGGLSGFSWVDGSPLQPTRQRWPISAARFFVYGETELSRARVDLLRIVLKDAVVACGGRISND